MPLGRSRYVHRENLSEHAYNLFLNFGIDLDKAKRMSRSEITGLQESNAYRDWRKSREAAHKVDAAVINRLDNVIRAIGNLGKAMSR